MELSILTFWIPLTYKCLLFSQSCIIINYWPSKVLGASGKSFLWSPTIFRTYCSCSLSFVKRPENFPQCNSPFSMVIGTSRWDSKAFADLISSFSYHLLTIAGIDLTALTSVSFKNALLHHHHPRLKWLTALILLLCDIWYSHIDYVVCKLGLDKSQIILGFIRSTPRLLPCPHKLRRIVCAN